MEKRFSIISYAQDNINTYATDNMVELLPHVKERQTTWITISAFTFADKEAIEQLLAYFAVTSISADQILSANLTEFIGEYHDCLYTEYSVPFQDETTQETIYATGSVILGKGFLLLFVARRIGLFNHIRQKLLAGNKQIQQYGPDYLLYQLIRAMITKIEDVLFRSLVEHFEELEDEVIASSGEAEIMDEILAMREQVKPFYDSVRRLAFFVETIQEEDSLFIGERTSQYFATRLERDVAAMWQGYFRLRTWGAELLDIHRANVGEKTNHVIHILTIVSTIFLPITFLSSLYGMNFVNMPELKNPYAYPITLLVMVLIVVGMIVYMKKKKWV